jgi:NADP-dependent 3-hydroxy acid dehydrogenase YdfG
MAAILEGTVALVTGASSGIGEATALRFAALGAHVAIVARRADRLADLAARITATGGNALELEADITDANQARDVIEQTVRRFGRLDTLINNAGVMLLGPISGAEVTEWKRMIDLNVWALMHCSHAALPHLLAAASSGPRNVADLVNISSTAGRNASAGAGVYNATKFAIGAFSESLRQEITKQHVRVALVEPGFTATELQSHNSPEIQDMIRTRFALDEPLQADDIADAVLYVVTRPRHVAVNEMLVRPTLQDR